MLYNRNKERRVPFATEEVNQTNMQPSSYSIGGSQYKGARLQSGANKNENPYVSSYSNSYGSSQVGAGSPRGDGNYANQGYNQGYSQANQGYGQANQSYGQANQSYGQEYAKNNQGYSQAYENTYKQANVASSQPLVNESKSNSRVLEVLQKFRNQFEKLGANTIRSLGLFFRRMDSFDGNRSVDEEEFIDGLLRMGLKFDRDEAQVNS